MAQWRVLSYSKQIIHGHLILYDVVVAVTSDSMRRYHNEVKGAFVLRQFAVGINLVLQFFFIILLNSEYISRMLHLAEVSETVGTLNDQVYLCSTSVRGSSCKPGTHISLNARDAERSLYLPDVPKANTLKSMALPGVVECRCEAV